MRILVKNNFSTLKLRRFESMLNLTGTMKSKSLGSGLSNRAMDILFIATALRVRLTDFQVFNSKKIKTSINITDLTLMFQVKASNYDCCSKYWIMRYPFISD